MASRTLVTSALPYANGHLHLGHLVEYVMTDVWVRFQRLRGEEVAYLCADDTHGTAIMIRARQEGRSEEEVIAEMHAAHVQDFAAFDVVFDHFGSTHSPSTRARCEEIWAALGEAGMIRQKEVQQLYDPVDGTFLADRFVKGRCPSCDSPGQYGDNCDRCGATYAAHELKDAVSVFSGARPELRQAVHQLVHIEGAHRFLAEWTQTPGRLQPENQRFFEKFLEEPLHDWDVSRPARYFGFEIPGFPGNYWYVWFDAPIGYLGATADWCAATGQDLDRWWRSAEVRLVHFIGKDIMRFHCLFWPAMLRAAGYHLPDRVHAHGFLTVNGEKMSKSKGTFILARTWLEAGLEPAFLRWYYASKQGPGVDDLDLDLEELVTRVNAELVGKVVNLASRSARFVDRLSDAYPEDGGLFGAGAAAGEAIAAAYERCDYAAVIRQVLALADAANQYVDQHQPWALKKDPARAEELRQVVTVVLNLFRQLAVYLAPVLPRLAEQTAALLGRPLARWDEAATPVLGVAVAPFTAMVGRVDPKKVAAMVAASAVTAPAAAGSGAGDAVPGTTATVTAGVSAPDQPPAAAPAPGTGEAEPLAPECSVDDFAKVDLRVARVVKAEAVEGADKLLRLEIDLGPHGVRQVFAGIKASYAPESLVGRLVVVVANLAPRKMRFGVSHGMVAAAGPPGKDVKRVFVLSPDEGAEPGMRLH